MGRVRFLSHPAAPYLLNAEEREGSIVLQLNLRHVFLLAVCCYNSATNLAQSWRINSGFVTKHMVRYYLVFSTCLPVKYETKYLPWRKFKHCTLYLPPVFSLTVPDGKRRESFAQLHGNAVKFQLFIVVVLTDRVEVKGRLSRGRCATGSESCPSRWHCTHLPWAVFWILSQLTRRPSWHRQLLSSK